MCGVLMFPGHSISVTSDVNWFTRFISFSNFRSTLSDNYVCHNCWRIYILIEYRYMSDACTVDGTGFSTDDYPPQLPDSIHSRSNSKYQFIMSTLKTMSKFVQQPKEKNPKCRTTTTAFHFLVPLTTLRPRFQLYNCRRKICDTYFDGACSMQLP